MSLVAQCPACSTAFIVKPEQLAAHRGDVRCGQCQQVFNALAHLSESADINQQESEIAAPPSPQVAFDFAFGSISETLTDEASHEPVEPIEIPPSPFSMDNETPLASVETEEVQTFEMPAEELPAATETFTTPATAPEPETKQEQQAEVIDFPVFQTWQPVIEPAEVPEKKRSGWLTFLLILVSVLLLALLSLQIIYLKRTEIAQHWPQAKPLLVKACEPLHCEIALPQNADLLAIDDSDLTEDTVHQHVYFLTSTLTNHAEFTQAFPLLELSLTDLNDQVIMRRTLHPSEYLPNNANESTGIGANDEVHIKLPITIADLKISGYRVYIRYP
jgi:predicted Zn finger-like uncharacterized protein